MYGSCGLVLEQACCRAGNLFSNYILSFPPSSTAAERAMLLVAIFQLDYQMCVGPGACS